MPETERIILFRKLALISSFIAVVTFLLGTTVAVFAYPDYKFFTQFFSELGVRVDVTFSDGELLKAKFPEIFNISLILTGIFLLPFFPLTYFILKPQGIVRKIPFVITSISGLFGALFLTGVGIFDAGAFIDEHIFMAVGLYYCIAITSLCWGIGILLLNKDSPYKQSKLWIVDPFVCLLSMLIGMINIDIFGLSHFFIGETLTMAFYQKSLAYVFIIVFGYVAVRLATIMQKNAKIVSLEDE